MTQAITPELRQWIVTQAQQGFAADAVLKSMMDSGWKEEVAIEALETTLREHLEGIQKPAEQAAVVLPAAVPVPRPAMDDSPLYLDAGRPPRQRAEQRKQPAHCGVWQCAVRR